MLLLLRCTAAAWLRLQVRSYARDFFNRAGELRHIKRLKFWDLEAVLHEKYRLPRAEVRAGRGDGWLLLLPLTVMARAMFCCRIATRQLTCRGSRV
jgi:hypothetical protein